MNFEYDSLRSIALFAAGIIGAGLGLRLFLRWRYATNLARARRIAVRLQEPATSLAGLEDHSAALEELADFADPRAAVAAVREILDTDDATVRSAAIEVLRQTRALELWRRQLRKGSYQSKIEAIRALGEVGDERAVDELLEALSDDDPDVARAAAHAICARDPDYACERLAAALESPNRRLAETAAAALVHRGEYAIDYLVAQLANISPQARRLAAESLGAIGEENLKDILIPLLITDPATDVRTAVAEAIARLDGETAIEEIQRLARCDPDWFVRARAYSLLAEMNAEGAEEYLLEGLVSFEQQLAPSREDGQDVEAFTAGSKRVRRAIVAGLRMLGFSEDQVDAIGRNPSELSGEESERASIALSLLHHRDAAQRIHGVKSLSEMGPLAAEVLASVLSDPDPLVRGEVARSLGKIGSRDSLGSLSKCLQDPDPSVRLAAASALRAVVTREAAKELTD